MIIEYSVSDFCDPSLAWKEDTWSGRIAVNLLFVTFAQLSADGVTLIGLVGSRSPILIKEDFDRFMRSWQAAKR